jgi:hypothetical protein
MNSEGLQCKIPAGIPNQYPDKFYLHELNQMKMKYIWEHDGQDPDKLTYSKDKEEWGSLYKNKYNEIADRFNLPRLGEYQGYQLRKRIALGDGIEVLADLDAKGYDEFEKKYRGYQGLIDILMSTERVLTGHGGSPESAAKKVVKMIKMFEIEAEDE